MQLQAADVARAGDGGAVVEDKMLRGDLVADLEGIVHDAISRWHVELDGGAFAVVLFIVRLGLIFRRGGLAVERAVGDGKSGLHQWLPFRLHPAVEAVGENHVASCAEDGLELRHIGGVQRGQRREQQSSEEVEGCFHG